MEYVDPTGERVEILACDSCFEPEWITAFTKYPDLQVHWCDGESDWRYGYYGTDTRYKAPEEALVGLIAYQRAVERWAGDNTLQHIDEALDG